MNGVWTIAAHTFRENRRDRILYILVIFAAVIILASVLVGELSPFEQKKILLDLGQSVMTLAGLPIAVLLGIGLVSREIERRTIYVVISKPVGRTEFLLGKVAGLVITLTVALGIMAATLAAVTWAYGAPPSLPLAQSVALMWMELVLVITLAVTFASFSSAALSAMLTVLVWVIGQVLGDLRVIAERTEHDLTRGLLEAAYWVLPNMSLFDAKARATYAVAVPAGQMAWSMGYGVIYATVLLGIAAAVFSRRDFR